MKQDTTAAREVALAALNNVDRNQAYSGLVLQAEARKNALTPREQRLVWKLVYGVITYRLSLDYALNQFCKRDVGRLSPSLRNILRLACYQLIYLDRIPDFAAVHQAVSMARRISGQKMAGFVNGVLRNVVRSRDDLFNDLPYTPEGIAIRHSHPLWMVEKWIERWGTDFAAQLCQANNLAAPMTIRVNTEKISVEDYAALAVDKGLNPVRGRFSSQALVFPSGTSFSDLPGFSQGFFIVQGEASMLVADCLSLNSGQSAIDMCSAPGGKATHIASIVRPGRVIACDLHESRIGLIRTNASRLGLENIEAFQADAVQLPRLIGERFDRVLVDAPCTGLGVIRKKPDIKWTRKQEDIGTLAALQRKLLFSGCELLKPGGILVYSTCTLVKEENQDIIHSVLAEREDIEPEVLISPGLQDKDGFIRTFPHRDDLDGFFIAKLKKVV